MMFDDDEQIVTAQDVSGTEIKQITVGRLNMTVIHNQKAPLVETDFKVKLEITGVGSGKQRSGVDLVMVLDVSESMGRENKLENMKVATQFVIRKLSPVDRLSVVTFSDGSSRLCPLRQMTEVTKVEIGNLVDSLQVAGGGTNIADGLKTGLQVIHERQITSGRAFAVMLISNRDQNVGDATQVNPGDVPVYTFGFGTDQNPQVLKTIASSSVGGVFSDVQNTYNLSVALSQCLAGLLNREVEDLTLIVTKLLSTAIKVYAGHYPQSLDDATGSLTVSLGDLYNGEVRKVILELILPAVKAPCGTEVVELSYTYSTHGKLVKVPPVQVYIKRVGNPSPIEDAEVMMEENRLQTASMMKDARVMADDKNLDDALNKIDDAQNFLNEFSSSSRV